MRPFILRAGLFVGSLFAVTLTLSAHAGTEPPEPKRPSCMDLLLSKPESPPISKLRQSLLAFLEEKLARVRDTKESLNEAVEAVELAMRTHGGDDEGTQGRRLSDETVRSLISAFGDAAQLRSASERHVLALAARDAVMADTYLGRLEETQARQTSGARIVRPQEALLLSIDWTNPLVLPLHLAILNVRRRYDPSLAPATAMIVDVAVKHYYSEKIIERWMERIQRLDRRSDFNIWKVANSLEDLFEHRQQINDFLLAEPTGVHELDLNNILSEIDFLILLGESQFDNQEFHALIDNELIQLTMGSGP